MLFTLLNSYHAEIEYDFDIRGWDLLDVWRGRVSLRKVSVRISQILLDRTSSTMRAIAPHETRWGELEHLVATGIDTMIALKSTEPRNAPTVPRPGDKERATAQRDVRRSRFEERQKAAEERAARQREGRA